MGRGLRCCVVVFWGLSSVDAGVVTAGDVGAVEGSRGWDGEFGDEGEGESECSSLDVPGDGSDIWLVALAPDSSCSGSLSCD